jgi:hypothetical protein
VIGIVIKELPIRTASSVRKTVQLVVRTDQVKPQHCTILLILCYLFTVALWRVYISDGKYVTWDSQGSITITVSDIPPYNLVDEYLHFWRICSLHLLERGLLCPEGRGRGFLRNVGTYVSRRGVTFQKAVILTQSENSGGPPSRMAYRLSLCLSTIVCRRIEEMRWSSRFSESSASCSDRFTPLLPYVKT